MSNLKEIAQKIKESLHPFYQSIADTCRTMHQNYLTKENQRKTLERNNKIELNMYILRKELYEVFSTSNYARLIQVKTLNNVRPVSYEIQQGKILYMFSIDKEQIEQIASTICTSLRDNMNNDITTYSQFLTENYFLDELWVAYPNLYYGVKVLNVTNEETNVRLTVVSNRPL